jgi:membrane-associated phospholipid phosphatase
VLRIQSFIMPILALSTIPLCGLLYFFLNHDGNGAYSLVTDFDRVTPFLKVFVVPYLFWYIFLVFGLLYLCSLNRSGFYKTVLIYDLGILSASLIYYVFQTTVPRPSLIGDDWLTSMVSFVYQMDQPYNCFPSTHVLTTYLIMRSIQQYSQSAGLKLVTHLIGLSIILSTVLIKQHVILDAIASIIIVEILYRAVHYFAEEGIGKWVKRQSSSLMTKKRYEI